MTRLRELIEEKGITQKQVALDLGWPRKTFNNYVCGNREPDYDALCRLCDYFGCTSDYFLGRSENRLPVINEEDGAILRAYHALPLEIRRAVDGLMEPYKPATESEKKMA